MQNYKNGQLIIDENSCCKVAVMTVIGDREEQQDSFGYSLRESNGVIVICDGMGGHEEGKTASDMAVKSFINEYEAIQNGDLQTEMLIRAAKKSNEAICSLKNEKNEKINAGTTVVSVLINKSKLEWCSVGDSRAYLIRKDEMVQLTQDHNYLTVLKEKLNAGIIDIDEFNKEKVRGEALISYLGIGELGLIDYSAQPFDLIGEDKIVLMSDGLYKIITEEEMLRIITNFSNIGEAIQALELKVRKNAKAGNINRDNMTISIIQKK